jgi:hypothetical protein
VGADGGRFGSDSAARSSPWRRALANLALAGVGLLAGLALAEAALRVGGYSPGYVNPWGAIHRSDPQLGYLGKPNLEMRWAGHDFDIRVAHDERGFRRLEHQNTDAPHDLYALGDSFTWGWGVDQGQGYVDLLIRRLPDYRVHNCGVIGYGTAGEYTLFTRFVKPSLKPGDLLLLAFYSNDFGDNAQSAEVEPDGTITFRPEPRFSDRLVDSSYLFNLVAYRWNYAREACRIRRIQEEMRNLGSAPGGAKPLPDDDPRMLVTRHYLELFRADAAAAGARFVVVYFSDPWEYDPDVRDDHPYLAANVAERLSFQRLAAGLELETIDLLEPFRSAFLDGSGEPLVYGPHDLHWTPRGHVVAADAIAAGLGGVGGDAR